MPKRIIDDVYVHVNWICDVDDIDLRSDIESALRSLSAYTNVEPNVVKVNLNSRVVSLLCYEDFSQAAFPELRLSWTFSDGIAARPVRRDYSQSRNPPILHRKELLVGAGHPGRESWSEVTHLAESLGLFDDASSIGYRDGWLQAIESRGFVISGGSLVPLGNSNPEFDSFAGSSSEAIYRHRTALHRSSLSSPVQLLVRHGILIRGVSFFDYGCGHADDVRELRKMGIEALGWDPFFFPLTPRVASTVVNLGFVINVIEDADERAYALRAAAGLALGTLAVSTMIGSSTTTGATYGDGVVTGRRTFQKYYTQREFHSYLERVLSREVHMVAPGTAFLFFDEDSEQRFRIKRFRRGQAFDRIAARGGVISVGSNTAEARRARRSLGVVREPSPEVTMAIERVWQLALELGRWPERDEITAADELESCGKKFSQLRQLAHRRCVPAILAASRAARADDLRVYFASLLFSHRPSFRRLEQRIQRDVKSFFGNLDVARKEAVTLLRNSANEHLVMSAIDTAVAAGLGYRDSASRYWIHLEIIHRLPAVLRVLIDCAMRLWNSNGDISVVRVQALSLKISLFGFEDFNSAAVPTLSRAIKLNLRTQHCDEKEYSTLQSSSFLFLWKGKVLEFEHSDYAEQTVFDRDLVALNIGEFSDPFVNRDVFMRQLQSRRRRIVGGKLETIDSIPPLDSSCGVNFSYRDFIECGESQRRTRVNNVPVNPRTFNALFDLATFVIDPIVDYFGRIKLTYGVCCPGLARHIHRRVAPKIDQHASFESNRLGNQICSRGGAACDFIVEDEDMTLVAQWIVANTPFDRLYFYGADRPLHVSYSDQHSREAYQLITTKDGRLYPRPFVCLSVPPPRDLTSIPK